VRAVDHDLVSADFPTGIFPTKNKEPVGKDSWVKIHRGSEDREFRVHVHLDTANPETPMISCCVVI
jgi:hypothetical protein